MAAVPPLLCQRLSISPLGKVSYSESGLGDLECELRILPTLLLLALTTYVATYQLFNGEQQLTTLPAIQLENIQASVRTKKSDRLALKEEEDQEEVEDQAFSPKPVRLEKYDLPTDDDLNSPKHLSS